MSVVKEETTEPIPEDVDNMDTDSLPEALKKRTTVFRFHVESLSVVAET
jgi:hypothetical protein